MKKEHSVTFNFIMNFILTASSFIFPLITFPYVSRILLPAGNGKIDAAAAVVTYFSMFSMLGIPTYGIRACAQVRDDKEQLSRTVQEILCINAVMTALVYVVFGASLYVVPKFAEDRTLLLVMGTTIFLNMAGVSWLYSALEEYAYITMVSLAFKATGVLLMFLFVHDAGDYVVYGWITVVSNVGSYLFNFLRLGRYITIKPVGNYKFRRHLKPIGIFCAMTIATSIYTNLDIVMLKFISGDVQTGYYTASVKIKTIVTSLVTSLGAVLLPRLSYYIEKGMKEEFKRMAAKAFGFVLLIALPLAVYFTMFAYESIGLVSGKAYLLASWPMRLIMPTVVFIGLSNILGMQVLVPTGRERQVLVSMVAGALVDLALNLALIPRLGASGASIGTLMAEIVVVLVQGKALKGFLSELWQGLKLHYYIAGLLPAAIAAQLARMALKPIVDGKFALEQGCFVVLAVTGALFFGIYGILLLLLKEPITMEYIFPILQKLGKRNGTRKDEV